MGNNFNNHNIYNNDENGNEERAVVRVCFSVCVCAVDHVCGRCENVVF